MPIPRQFSPPARLLRILLNPLILHSIHHKPHRPKLPRASPRHTITLPHNDNVRRIHHLLRHRTQDRPIHLDTPPSLVILRSAPSAGRRTYAFSGHADDAADFSRGVCAIEVGSCKTHFPAGATTHTYSIVSFPVFVTLCRVPGGIYASIFSFSGTSALPSIFATPNPSKITSASSFAPVECHPTLCPGLNFTDPPRIPLVCGTPVSNGQSPPAHSKRNVFGPRSRPAVCATTIPINPTVHNTTHFFLTPDSPPTPDPSTPK